MDKLQTELPPQALWEAENWIIRDGVFQKRPGNAIIGATFTGRPMGLIQYKHNDGASRVVTGTTTAWRKWDGTAWTALTGALTGGSTDQVVYRVFDKAGTKYLLGTNTANNPKKWDGTTAGISDIAGTPPRAKCMMVLADRVILFNLQNAVGTAVASGAAYDVSEIFDFDSGWGAIQNGLLVDVPGEINAALELGNLTGAIYGDEGLWKMYAQGGRYPFRPEFVQRIFGPLAPHCVVPLAEGAHAFLGNNGGVYIFDGVSVTSLGRHIHKFIAEHAELAALNKAHGFFDPELSVLEFFYKEAATSDVLTSVRIEIPSGAMWPMRYSVSGISVAQKLKMTHDLTIGELTMPIGQITSALSGLSIDSRQVLYGITSGQINVEGGYASEEAFFETGLFDFGSPMLAKTIAETELLYRKAASAMNASVQYGLSDYGEPRTLSDVISVPIGGDGPYKAAGQRTTRRRYSLRNSVTASQHVEFWGAVASMSERGLR